MNVKIKKIYIVAFLIVISVVFKKITENVFDLFAKDEDEKIIFILIENEEELRRAAKKYGIELCKDCR